jgi:hypothetical protein
MHYHNAVALFGRIEQRAAISTDPDSKGIASLPQQHKCGMHADITMYEWHSSPSRLPGDAERGPETTNYHRCARAAAQEEDREYASDMSLIGMHGRHTCSIDSSSCTVLQPGAAEGWCSTVGTSDPNVLATLNSFCRTFSLPKLLRSHLLPCSS